MKALENRRSLKRRAFECYAKAVACRELGGEFLPKARIHASEGIELLNHIVPPDAEDEELKDVLQKFIR